MEQKTYVFGPIDVPEFRLWSRRGEGGGTWVAQDYVRCWMCGGEAINYKGGWAVVEVTSVGLCERKNPTFHKPNLH